MNVLIKRLPLSLVDKSPLFNLSNSPTLLSSTSTLDLETYPEDVVLLMSNEILIPSPMSDLPLQRINNIDHPVFLPELEATLNTNQPPPVDNPARIVSYPPLLPNDSSLAPDVPFNNPPSPLNDTPTLIVTYTLVSLSLESTLTITHPPASDYQIHVLIKHYNCRYFLSLNYSISMTHLHFYYY